MTRAEVRVLQRQLNHFTKTYLRGVTPLIVDGKKGRATNARIRLVKHYLGYEHGPRSPLNAIANRQFRLRLTHVKGVRYSTPARIARGMRRRMKQRRDWQKNHSAGGKTTGVSLYDGRYVANWMIPYLNYARRVGRNGLKWRGQVTSGWRDPAYSRSLCIRMCGAPTCPGRCAGTTSHHVGSVKPHGALDVSDYVRFGWIMQTCPFSPRLRNTLGSIDPVHYSPEGN